MGRFARFRKSLASMVFARSGGAIGGMGMSRSAYQYRRDVGDGTGSSVVMAPMRWIMRTFPSAKLTISRPVSNGDNVVMTPMPDHRMLTLLKRPNPHYTGRTLMKATALDYNLDGNAYWLKIRNGYGAPIQLYWVPHTLMTPMRNDGSPNLVDYYEYRPEGFPIRVEVADVVHFRDGIDPTDTMKGMAPLKTLLREIFTDDEAANFTASLLRNMGVPGIVISPKDDIGMQGAPPSDEDVKATKRAFKQATTGDNRGEPLVMTAPTDLQVVGFSPAQMNLRDIRRLPEERVTAVLGVAAVTCGLGAGLDRSTFKNVEEADKQSWQNNIVPAQDEMAADLHHQLLPDFESNPDVLEVSWDRTDVKALQDDLDELADRWNKMVAGGWAEVAEAREAFDLPVDESHRIYLRPVNLIEVPAGQMPDDGTGEPADTAPLVAPPEDQGDGETDPTDDPSGDSQPTKPKELVTA